MKTCYLFDIDLIERHRYPTFPKLPNHALMKFSSYYKSKGYDVKLVYNTKRIPPFYKQDNIYIGSALYTPNLHRFKKRLKRKTILPNQLKFENIHIGTPTDHCSITDIPGLKCDYTEYDEMLQETNIKLEWYPANIGFLTRGCKRHCHYCVNRDKNEIVPVNTLEEIYTHKGARMELLDDNLLASDNAVELLNNISEFYDKEKVPFKLRNGLDCRVVPEDKLQALINASKAFQTFHCAWDEVKNSYIFNNIRRINAKVSSEMYCYILTGIKVHSEEELRQDLLALFYRYMMLKKIKVHPYIAVFEDDLGEYQNPYWNIYALIKRQYGFQKQSYRCFLKRNINRKYTPIADKIIDVLGEYSFLVEESVRQVTSRPDFNNVFRNIASEIGVKHYDV